MKNQFLTFIIKDKKYGINPIYVEEIIGLQKITKLPIDNKFSKGIIMFRGKPTLLLDLSIILGVDNLKESIHDKILIINFNNKLTALKIGLIDTLISGMTLEKDSTNKLIDHYIKHNEYIIPILNLELILNY